MYTVSQNSTPSFFVISWPNIDRFSKFFQWHTLRKICNKVITKDPATPETTLPCEIEMHCSLSANSCLSFVFVELSRWCIHISWVSSVIVFILCGFSCHRSPIFHITVAVLFHHNQGQQYSTACPCSRRTTKFVVCRGICCLPQKKSRIAHFCYIFL